MNNRMVAILSAVAAGTAAVALLAGTLGLNLSGARLIAFCAALTAIITAATGVVLWMRGAAGQAAAAETPAQDSKSQADIVFAEGEARLRRIQATFDSRPALFVLGPQGSAKTSTLMNCSITAEPLAGQPSSSGQTVPTQAANLLLIGDTVAVDTAGALLNDSAGWTRVIDRFRPKVRRRSAEAPRSALVCVPCDELLQGGDAIQPLAQTIRKRLEEAAETLGVRFPVYILFTRTDRVRFFAEFMSALTQQEALDQVLGVSFPVLQAEAGLHADVAERKFGGAFDEMYQALSTARLEQLSRTESAGQRPAVYEFPREFGKLRAAVVKLLTELDRPSRLVMAPFVRGFYFSGVRPVMTEIVSTPVEAAPPPEAAPAGNATGMFQTGGAAPQRAMRSAGTVIKKRVPQWMFLRPLFDRVILNDAAARTLSAGSVHVSHRLRLAYATVSGICLIAVAVLLTSLFANKGLVEPPQTVAQSAAAQAQAPAAGLARVDELRELERLREELLELRQWRDGGRPLHMGWGLYTGNDLEPAAARIYFRRFEQLLWRQVHARNNQRLRALPAVRRETDEYQPSYDALKAHLVMTTEHRRPANDWASTWLSGWLFNEWAATHAAAAPEQKDLAKRQFDFYAAHLRQQNPFRAEADNATVTAARTHLLSFSNVDQIYNSLRTEASKASEPVRFPVVFPDAAQTVTNTYVVDGAWTAKGWAALSKALREEKFGGEPWVLGPRAVQIQNPEQLRADIMAAYRRDYIAQWVQYLRRTAVVSYKDPMDAASKLRILSSANTSPLLASLWLASQHTAVDEQVRKEFAAVHEVVPHAPDGSRNFVSQKSQQYAGFLSNLAVAVDTYAAGPDAPGAAAQVRVKAVEARHAVANLAGVLPRGSTDAAVRSVASVLEQPITQFHIPDPAKAAAAAMDGAGKAFCKEWDIIARKYPFNERATADVTVEELAAVFGRPAGHLVKLEAAVAPAGQFNGTSWVPNPTAQVKLNPRFVNFFTTASRLGRAMFPTEGTVPNMRFSLRWHPSDMITSVTVSIEGTTATYQGSSQEVKSFVWTGAPTGQVKLRPVAKGGTAFDREYQAGTASLFRFFDDANVNEAPRLTWLITSGKSNQPLMIDGKQLKYEFTVDPPVLNRQSWAGVRCESQVTIK